MAKEKKIKLKRAWKLEQEGRWFMAKPYELASNPDPISLYSQSSAKNIVVVIRKGSGESAPIEIYFKARAPTSKAFEVLPLHTIEEIDREARGELPLALSKVTYRYYTKVRLSHRLYPLISPAANAAMTNAGSQGVMSNPHFERLYDTLADVDLDIQDTAIFFAACAFSRTQHYGINKLLEVADRRVTNAKKNRTSISGYNDPQLIKDKLGKEPLYIAEMVIGTNDPANIRKVLEALPRNGNAFFIKHGPGKLKDAEKILKWKLNKGSAISTWGQIKSDLFNKPTIREKIILNVEELQLLLRLPRNPTSYPFVFGVPVSRIQGVPVEDDIIKDRK